MTPAEVAADPEYIAHASHDVADWNCPYCCPGEPEEEDAGAERAVVERSPEAEADQLAERAAKIAHTGHDGYGSDDRAGYAAIAQVYATLALHAEIRALRLQLADVLQRGER